jgi:AraC-like DNA-binding protein
MKCPNHLGLERIELAPSAECAAEFPGWCFLQVRNGQGYWIGRNQVRELGAGEVAVLSPLREGCFRASQLGPVALACFRFTPELLGGLLTPTERDAFESLAAHAAYAARFFTADSPGARHFAELAGIGAGRSAFAQRAELLRLVAALFAEELVQPVPPDHAFLSARQRLRLLVNQIPESEFLRLSPVAMAGRCGSSVTHFHRSFRKLFGMSLGRKQELIRLQQARQMLMETCCRPEEVSSAAGFRDVQEFASAFKKEYGVTPAEWRHPRLGPAGAPEPLSRPPRPSIVT